MYKSLLELTDDLNWLAKTCNMKVRHFRLYRKTASRSREVVLLYNPSYAGYAGDDQIDLRYYLHICVFEKETTQVCNLTTYRLDIRQSVADDFTLIVGDNGDIKVAGVCSGVVYTIPESPSLGDVREFSPALLHEGEINPDWFAY